LSYRFSDQAQRLDADDGAAWAVHDQALEMQRAGEDVVVLSIGDPDFRTPDPIVDNAVSHMRVGRTHYSPALGELNLRRAVADYEILIVDPQYVGYAPITQALNVNVDLVYATADTGFVIQLETILAGITPDTRVVFINTPANPTGAIVERDTLRELARVCQQKKIWLGCRKS